VAIHLTDEELRLILTKTDVARTKKLRPRLETIVGSQQDVELSVHEWGRLVFSSCGAGREAHYEGPARKHFNWWYCWATHSQLPPMVDKARMLKTHLPNILTYLKLGITNATSESLNSKIQWIKYTARGFRNFKNFVNAIYFHCGGLDLAPSAT
jgi:hypothetical protein